MSTTTSTTSEIQEINTKFGLERHGSVESVNSSINDDEEDEFEDDENFELDGDDDHDLVNLLKQKYNGISSMPPLLFTNTRYYCALKLHK